MRMSREQTRKLGLSLVGVGVLSFLISLATGPWLMALAALTVFPGIWLAVGSVGTPEEIIRLRKESSVAALADKRLNIEEMVFPANSHWVLKTFCLSIFFFLSCAALAFAYWGATTGDAFVVVFSILFLLFSVGLGCVVFDAFGTTLKVDAAAISMHSPFRKASIPWKEIVYFAESVYGYNYNRMVIYEVFGSQSSISFGEQLRNAPRLVHIIQAALAYSDAAIDVGELPPVQSYSKTIVALLGAFGGIATFVGLLMFYASMIDYNRIHLPLIPVASASKYLGSNAEVRVRGTYQTLGQYVESRDKKHEFGYQYIEVQSRGKSSTQLYTGWVPTKFLIQDQKAQVAVKGAALYQDHAKYQGQVALTAGWKETPIGNLISPVFDEDVKRYEGQSDDIKLFTVDIGESVSVVGRPTKDSNGETILDPGPVLWMSNKSDKEMDSGTYTFMAISAGIFLLGIVLNIAAFMEFKKR